MDGSSNNTSTSFEVPRTQEKLTTESSASIASAAAVFMADVANLIKYELVLALIASKLSAHLFLSNLIACSASRIYLFLIFFQHCRLVDTRDIVELELKQKNYELIIRKKEAMPPPPAPQQSAPGPHVMAHTTFPMYQPQQQQSPSSIQEAPAAAPSAPPAPAPVNDAIPAAAEHPPMLSPMAGTFYKCPGPGEPPYVKVF